MTVKEHAAALGALGGKRGTGAAKRRSRAHYVRIAKLRRDATGTANASSGTYAIVAVAKASRRGARGRG